MPRRPAALLLAGLAFLGFAVAFGGAALGATSASGASPPSTVTTVPPPGGHTPASYQTVPICVAGGMAVTVSVTKRSSPICLVRGTKLTVTFDKTHAAIGKPGPWGVPRVQVYPRILTIRSTSTRGAHLTAHLVARTLGTTTVRAGFGQECTKGDTTPCTIPPQAILTLDVTVVARQR